VGKTETDEPLHPGGEGWIMVETFVDGNTRYWKWEKPGAEKELLMEDSDGG